MYNYTLHHHSGKAIIRVCTCVTPTLKETVYLKAYRSTLHNFLSRLNDVPPSVVGGLASCPCKPCGQSAGHNFLDISTKFDTYICFSPRPPDIGLYRS